MRRTAVVVWWMIAQLRLQRPPLRVRLMSQKVLQRDLQSSSVLVGATTVVAPLLDPLDTGPLVSSDVASWLVVVTFTITFGTHGLTSSGFLVVEWIVPDWLLGCAV